MTSKACSALVLAQRAGFGVLALAVRLLGNVIVPAERQRQQQPWQQQQRRLQSPALAPVSTQCVDEFVALNANGTELDRLFQSRYLNEDVQSTCVVTPFIVHTVCTRDYRRVNTSTYQALCERSGNNDSSTDNLTASGDATTINATMIKYDIVEGCTPGLDPLTYEILVDRPLCIPDSCNIDTIPRQVQELYNDHYAEPALCNAIFAPNWRTERGRRGSCYNETLALNTVRLNAFILSEIVYPDYDAMNSCQGAQQSTDQNACVIDYRLANTSDYETICNSLDGTMLRHDVSVQCTLDNGVVETVTVRSEPRCVGPSCTAPEALDTINYVPSDDLELCFDETMIDESCVLSVTEPSDEAVFTTPTNATSTGVQRWQHYCIKCGTAAAMTTAATLAPMLFAAVGSL